MFLGVGLTWFACLLLELCIQSAATGCGVCPPGRDGGNGRDGHPGRDGMPGRDGTPGICLGQTEQDKQIKQLRQEVNELKARRVTHLPSGARVCEPGSYLACLPKSPSPYINHTSCSSGYTLYNGVCYTWPTSPKCQTRDLHAAHKTCTGLGGRLCTVPELDRLGGTGCQADNGGSWALLGLRYGVDPYQGYGICFRDEDSYRYADVHSTPFPVKFNIIETLAWCNAVSSLPAEAQSNIEAFVICCKT